MRAVSSGAAGTALTGVFMRPGKEKPDGDASHLVDIDVLVTIADHDGTHHAQLGHLVRVIRRHDDGIARNALKCIAVDGYVHRSLVTQGGARRQPVLHQGGHPGSVQHQGIARIEPQLRDGEAARVFRQGIDMGLPAQRELGSGPQGAHHAAGAIATRRQLMGLHPGAGHLLLVCTSGRQEGRAIFVLAQAARQGKTCLTLLPERAFLHFHAAVGFVIEGAQRDFARQWLTPRFPLIDGIRAFQGVRTVVAQGNGGLIGVGCRMVSQMQMMDRLLALEREAEVPCDPFLAPDALQESGIALTGLHDEGALRVGLVQAPRMPAQGGREDVVVVAVLRQYLVADLHDRAITEDAPGLALLQQMQGIAELDLEEYGTRFGMQLPYGSGETAHQGWTSVDILDGKPDRHPLKIVHTDIRRAAGTLQPIAHGAAHGFAAADLQRDELAYRSRCRG